jgi:hypothetical protein
VSQGAQAQKFIGSRSERRARANLEDRYHCDQASRILEPQAWRWSGIVLILVRKKRRVRLALALGRIRGPIPRVNVCKLCGYHKSGAQIGRKSTTRSNTVCSNQNYTHGIIRQPEFCLMICSCSTFWPAGLQQSRAQMGRLSYKAIFIVSDISLRCLPSRAMLIAELELNFWGVPNWVVGLHGCLSMELRWKSSPISLFVQKNTLNTFTACSSIVKPSPISNTVRNKDIVREQIAV